MIMEKDFDGWNEVKKMMHAKPDDFGVHERELWWVSLGVNVGVETDGKHETFERPVLVVKTFNRQMVWAVTTTTKAGDAKFYYRFLHNGKTYTAMLTQIKTMSTKRFIRKIGVMESDEFEKVRAGCRSFL